jgi:hypothetical protein
VINGWRVRVGCGAAVASALLAACGGAVETSQATVLVAGPATSGMDALGGGALEVVQGCLGVDDVVVVWPFRTRVVREQPLTIEVPGAGVVSLGEQVSLAGGFVQERDGAQPAPQPLTVGGVTVPAECTGGDVFLAHTGVRRP